MLNGRERTGNLSGGVGFLKIKEVFKLILDLGVLILLVFVLDSVDFTLLFYVGMLLVTPLIIKTWTYF